MSINCTCCGNDSCLRKRWRSEQLRFGSSTSRRSSGSTCLSICRFPSCRRSCRPCLAVTVEVSKVVQDRHLPSALLGGSMAPWGRHVGRKLPIISRPGQHHQRQVCLVHAWLRRFPRSSAQGSFCEPYKPVNAMRDFAVDTFAGCEPAQVVGSVLARATAVCVDQPVVEDR